MIASLCALGAKLFSQFLLSEPARLFCDDSISFDLCHGSFTLLALHGCYNTKSGTHPSCHPAYLLLAPLAA